MTYWQFTNIRIPLSRREAAIAAINGICPNLQNKFGSLTHAVEFFGFKVILNPNEYKFVSIHGVRSVPITRWREEKFFRAIAPHLYFGEGQVGSVTVVEEGGNFYRYIFTPHGMVVQESIMLWVNASDSSWDKLPIYLSAKELIEVARYVPESAPVRTKLEQGMKAKAWVRKAEALREKLKEEMRNGNGK